MQRRIPSRKVARGDPVWRSKMNLLNRKVVLSALGIVAVLAGPAFAQKRQHVTHANQSDVSSVVPDYDVSRVVPGYSKDGATVAIPNPDQR